MAYDGDSVDEKLTTEQRILRIALFLTTIMAVVDAIHEVILVFMQIMALHGENTVPFVPPVAFATARKHIMPALGTNTDAPEVQPHQFVSPNPRQSPSSTSARSRK